MPIYDGVNGVAREVTKIYDGVNGVAREVTKVYDGVDNVARQSFMSGVTWSKYSCNRALSHYQKTWEGNQNTASALKNFTLNSSTSGGFLQSSLYSNYSFSSETGYKGQGSKFIPTKIPSSTEEAADMLNGLYSVLSGSVQTFDVVDLRETTDTTFTVFIDVYLIARAEGIYKYSKGNTSYGTVMAPEGEPPEEGTLIEGSYDEGYCVLRIGSTYYYYVLED